MLSVVLQHGNALVYCLAFILGAAIGSFLNVVAYRLPKILFDREYDAISAFLIDESTKKNRFSSGIVFIDRLLDRNDIEYLLTKENCLPTKGMMYLALPGSSCPNCGHQIRFFENIPILGWLFLKGRCSSCRNQISCQYPLIELLTALLTLAVIYVCGITIESFLYAFLIWVLIALTLIDLEFYLLPDHLTLPLMWLGLILSYFDIISINFNEAFLGAITGYLSLWLINQLALVIFKKEGIGAGDFKLLAALGAWQGLGNLFNIILISSILGAVIGVVMVLKRDKKGNYIPYGPFLAVASVIVLLCQIEPDTFFKLL